MPDYRAGFESQYAEMSVDALTVEGEIPDWLSGTLIRNGPAQFEVRDGAGGEERYNHWFDGLSKLHAFQIGGGAVSYRSKFLETETRRTALGEGRITRSEFATDPCRTLFGSVMSVFRPKFTDNASITIQQLAGQAVAMTETPLPVAFDPETLEAAGVVEYADDLGAQLETAHPIREPGTGRLISHLTTFGASCEYTLAAIDPASTRRDVFVTHAVREPSYMHSFGMTESYVILAEWPLRTHPLELLKGRPFIENFNWRDGDGVTFRIFHKSDGEPVAVCHADDAFAFHHVNAFERDNTLVCDVAAYPDDTIVDDLYLDALRSPDRHPHESRFVRYTLPLTGGSATSEVVADTMIELPRIRDRHVGRPYRIAYGVGTSDRTAFTNQLVKFDVEDGRVDTWHEPGTYPGEPIFVAAPDGTDEDDGLVLSVVLAPADDASFLLVLDARTFTERARAAVPQRIPFGFHGAFLNEGLNGDKRRRHSR